MSVPAATLRELRDAIRRGDRTAVEVCEEALARVEAHDGARSFEPRDDGCIERWHERLQNPR